MIKSHEREYFWGWKYLKGILIKFMAYAMKMKKIKSQNFLLDGHKEEVPRPFIILS